MVIAPTKEPGSAANDRSLSAVERGADRIGEPLALSCLLDLQPFPGCRELEQLDRLA
jgi:hypothetical protein